MAPLLLQPEKEMEDEVKRLNRLVVVQECESSTGWFEGNRSLIVGLKLVTK